MTAFAQKECVSVGGTLNWEIKTVNHRYLEFAFKLPDRFRALEPKLRDITRARLQRGKLDAQLRYSLDVSQQDALQLNHPRLQQLVQGLDEVSKIAPACGTPSTLDILAWPGVLSEQQIDQQAMLAEAADLFAEGIEELSASRGREGEALSTFIQQRLAQLQTFAQQIGTEIPVALEVQQNKLRDRLADYGEQVDYARLEQELVLIAQKADITEELDRLATHCKEVERVLKKGGVCGRKLDFLMQELNRETNTLSAKSISSKISQAGVEMKVLIEQMREQIQNIE
ncbi:MAG: YicC/YloC family endoribonuclease [Pseudomonadales bacterium]